MLDSSEIGRNTAQEMRSRAGMVRAIPPWGMRNSVAAPCGSPFSGTGCGLRTVIVRAKLQSLSS